MLASQSGTAKYHFLYTLGAVAFQTSGVFSLLTRYEKGSPCGHKLRDIRTKLFTTSLHCDIIHLASISEISIFDPIPAKGTVNIGPGCVILGS